MKGKGAKHLLIEDKASILAYKEAGWSTKNIAERLGCDKATINRVLAASKATPDKGIPARKKGSGRPRKITEEVLAALKRQIMKYPDMTAGQLRQTVPELASLMDRRVQFALQKHLKMPSRVAALKPLLTEKMKRKRLAFCKQYQHWTAADWSTVMYLDESTFRCIRATNPG
jgi:transposase